MLSTALAALALPVLARAQTYSATYLPSNAPATTEQGQTGTNKCGSGSDQSSMCQNVFINAVDDFCVFAPPEPGPNSVIGNTERIEVSWCLKPGYGTRVMPAGTITGAHFVQTPDYVQVTGVGDLTRINIPSGDEGGELDPHGADGNGNPIGGLVFSSAFGQLQQLHEWTNFVAFDEFCIRGCKDGPNAPRLCQHIYDEIGCMWNMPANYDAGVFENCKGDTGEPMGVYGTSTFFQGEPVTPSAHPAPSSSLCTRLSTVGGLAAGGSSSSATSSSVSTPSTSVGVSSAPSSSVAASSAASGSASLSGSGSASASASASGSPSVAPSAGASSAPSIKPTSLSSGSSIVSSPSHASSSSSSAPSPTGATSAALSVRVGWESVGFAFTVITGIVYVL